MDNEILKLKKENEELRVENRVNMETIFLRREENDFLKTIINRLIEGGKQNGN